MSQASRGQGNTAQSKALRDGPPANGANISMRSGQIYRYGLIGFICSVAAAYYVREIWHKQQTLGGLEDTYALCSRYAPAIYTVDQQNTKVQCLLVRAGNILSTGTLGAYAVCRQSLRQS